MPIAIWRPPWKASPFPLSAIRARSVRPVRAPSSTNVYDAFLDRLKARAEKITVGPPDEPGNYMGPVISAGAQESILEYIDVGKHEGRILAGRRAGPRRRLFYCSPP